MKKLGLITDDMTGTMTCGVLLAKAGIQACSYFSPDHLAGAEKQEAVIISANSRNLPPEQAKQNVKRAYRALIAQGAAYFTKRIDTTFRGGIGYEVDALLEEMPEDTIAVMAAAMPDTHRVVVGGYSIIDGVILTETGAARDVLSPVNQAHIPTLMRSQSNNQVEEININTVLAGQDVLEEELSAKRSAGGKIIVIDALSTEHLHTIAHAVYKLGWNVLCVDPGAFSQQLALCRGFGNPERVPKQPGNLIDLESCTGKVIVVAGSATDVTRKQIGVLSGESCAESVSVDASVLIRKDQRAEEEIERAISRGKECAEKAGCKVLIFETAVSGKKLVLKEEEERLGLKKGEASGNINAALGKIVNAIISMPEMKDQLNGLYMTGGDTLVTVLQAIGAAGIRLIDTVIPQTNLGVIIGGALEGTSIVGKGGMIGKDDTAMLAVNRLFFETSDKK
ncbi:four-carbon acid sugar kinase family protein [Caproiciproducens faecalis]|uniref:Four-carbon acid sugar kinase family protein n=1 Tax=Caproiciproducens faecalis TaxID=2820301 RepID=A0ABS7DJT2_9FIRM|nr:four-carbon acid sugar kinase family protein [Caproiciproducens faecalis]MBW7571371.1 four-carbon acid sugar kinase family protein [Caproiciproducens faecalis]